MSAGLGKFTWLNPGVTFLSASVSALRTEAQLQPEWPGGILEWREE